MELFFGLYGCYCIGKGVTVMDLFEFVELYMNATDEAKHRFQEALTEYEVQLAFPERVVETSCNTP